MNQIKNSRFLILVLCFVFLYGCKDFKEAQCTGVKGFKINKINTDGLNADLILGIKNPNSIGFSVYPSEFDVMLNGVHLGKARSAKRVHIKANGEKDYAFTLKSDFKDVNPMDIMKLAAGGTSGNIQVKGNLKAGKFYLKKKFPIDIKERIRQ
jgi:LEA14-like dessication related protein